MDLLQMSRLLKLRWVLEARLVISSAFSTSLILGAFICLGALSPIAASGEGASFEPVWRMLTREQKQQFVAGYLHGMRDASQMTELLRDLVKDAPSAAGNAGSVEGSLDRLSQIYDEMGRASPETLTDGIDGFYANPSNHGAQLSAAITAAQASREQALLKAAR